jgi:hypothetical protein
MGTLETLNLTFQSTHPNSFENERRRDGGGDDDDDGTCSAISNFSGAGPGGSGSAAPRAVIHALGSRGGTGAGAIRNSLATDAGDSGGGGSVGVVASIPHGGVPQWYVPDLCPPGRPLRTDRLSLPVRRSLPALALTKLFFH